MVSYYTCIDIYVMLKCCCGTEVQSPESNGNESVMCFTHLLSTMSEFLRGS